VLLPEHATALRAKHCPVVQKPFDLQDLLTAIATILDAPRQPTVTSFPADSEGRPYRPEYAVVMDQIARSGSTNFDRTAQKWSNT